MVDLNLTGESCEHCDALEDGATVVTLTEAQRDLLHDIVFQILDAHKLGRVRMTVVDLDDVKELLKQLAPASRKSGEQRTSR